MITVKVTLEDDDYFLTGINTTFEGAQAYYYDEVYEVVTENFETGKETRRRIVNVELVPEAD